MGDSARLYSSLIPRERVADAAAWEFESLRGEGDAPRGAERLLSDRERRAYARGKADGVEEGRQTALAESARHGQEVARVLDELRGRFAELEAAGAEQVLDLALAVARAVLCREVSVARDSLLPVLRESIAQIIDQQAHPRVHLNPQDLNTLRADLDADAMLRGCRFIADSTVARGGCLVQTNQCEIDARLENRWRRVVEAIGLPDAVDAAPKVDPS